MLQLTQDDSQWLIESPIPRVRYQAKLLFYGEKDYSLLDEDPLINEIIELIKGHKEELLKSHSKADIYQHRLGFLADSDIGMDYPPLKELEKSILSSFDSEGIPRITIQLPKQFNGSGQPESAWILCDYPQILYALLKMGVKNDKTRQALAHLDSVKAEQGIPCLSNMPQFRGPGKKTDYCPIAALYTLKALSQDESTARGETARAAAENLLFHWSEDKKHFLFGVGTDYRKLKFPLVWYNILHVLKALSESAVDKEHPVIKKMSQVILDKKKEGFRWTPESMYICYKGQDFSNKKEPSPTLTLQVLKVLSALGQIKIEVDK